MLSPTLDHTTLTDAIEGLMDLHGIQEVVAATADVLYLKAEHLRASWQDESTALAYEKAAELVNAGGYRFLLPMESDHNSREVA